MIKTQKIILIILKFFFSSIAIQSLVRYNLSSSLPLCYSFFVLDQGLLNNKL